MVSDGPCQPGLSLSSRCSSSLCYVDLLVLSGWYVNLPIATIAKTPHIRECSDGLKSDRSSPWRDLMGLWCVGSSSSSLAAVSSSWAPFIVWVFIVLPKGVIALSSSQPANGFNCCWWQAKETVLIVFAPFTVIVDHPCTMHFEIELASPFVSEGPFIQIPLNLWIVRIFVFVLWLRSYCWTSGLAVMIWRWWARVGL